MSGPKFELGSLYITPGCLEVFQQSGDDFVPYVIRHFTGDYGDIDEHDRRENELSVQQGFRILSAYKLSTGVKFWVITEADRSSTTMLLPDEY